MYSDPQSVTINAIANSLPRVGSGINTGTFSKDDGTVRLGVSHSYGKRNRRQVRIDHKKVAPDPLVPATNVPYSLSIYLVADVPRDGYSLVEQKQIADAFLAWLTASSGANLVKFLGGES